MISCPQRIEEGYRVFSIDKHPDTIMDRALDNNSFIRIYSASECSALLIQMWSLHFDCTLVSESGPWSACTFALNQSDLTFSPGQGVGSRILSLQVRFVWKQFIKTDEYAASSLGPPRDSSWL